MQNQMQMANQPQLGTPVPGTTGGLPAPRGLPVTANPMAKQLQSMGRGNDSMLIHMTPEEVNSLQGLAMASGGSLTINPQTGLPEAGWLGKLLPTILGIAGAAFGLPTWAIGLGGAAAGTAITGDLGKGLAMGLQAYGGAGLGQAVGVGGKIASLGKDLGLTQSATGAANVASAATAPNVVTQATAPVAEAAGATGFTNAIPVADTLATSPFSMAPPAIDSAFTQPGFLGRFAAETSLPIGGIGKTLGPALAGSAMLSGISDATQPKLRTYKDEEEASPYTPMGPLKREVSFVPYEEMVRTGGAEGNYFTPSNPEPTPLYGERNFGFADGGLAELPASQDFQQMVDYFNAQNPGAITASMYPTALPAPSAPATRPAGGETIYNFNRPTQSPITPGGVPGMGGGFDFSNIDLSGLDLSGINFGGLNAPTEQRFTPDYYRGGIEIPASTPTAPTPQIPTPGAGYTEPVYNFAPQLPAPTAPPIMEQQPVPAYDYNYRDPYFFEEDFAERSGPGGMMQEQMSMFARGGPVDMKDGAFVVDARTVSELGNGSSNAGMELLARMGGKPLHGPGDGVSDSIPARIGGRQEARVARDEVVFSPEAVKRIGKGSEARGTAKLYALMDKAHKARKKAKRGEDTKVRKGLA